MAEITVSQVREELGGPDTDLISDSKLEDIIDDEETLYGSVARAARIIANTFSLEASKRMGPLSIEYQERAKTWLQVAQYYEEKIVLNADPFAGGISEADKKARAADSDRPTSDFRKGMFEIGGFDNDDSLRR